MNLSPLSATRSGTAAAPLPPLHVRRRGVGTPVVCLHAIAHDGADFDDFARRVGDRFEIIAPDWPGQGLSPADGGPAGVTHYTDRLEALLDDLGLERPILLGNSIGGAAAATYALRRPHRVRGLVLCNAGGLAPLTPQAQKAIASMQRFFAAGARGAGWFPAAYAAYYRFLVLPRAPDRRRALVSEGPRIAPILAEAWAGFAGAENDLTDRMGCISCPVLFAWAKDDRLLSWARSKSAAAQVPERTVALLRGGHAAFLEDPARFEQAFRRFAGDLPQ